MVEYVNLQNNLSGPRDIRAQPVTPERQIRSRGACLARREACGTTSADANAAPWLGAIDPALGGEAAGAGARAHASNESSPANVPEPLASNMSATDSGSGARTPPDLPPAPAKSPAPAPEGAEGEEELPSHEVRRFTGTELTEKVFRPIWESREPLVVTGLLGKFAIEWKPAHIMEKYRARVPDGREPAGDGG